MAESEQVGLFPDLSSPPSLTTCICETCLAPMPDESFDSAQHVRVYRLEGGSVRAFCSLDCARAGGWPWMRAPNCP